MPADPIVVPRSFLDQPRWWHEGRQWLEDLPRLAAEHCGRWDLRVDGELWHGSNSLVIPVVRKGERLVLRLAPAPDEVAAQVDALRFWAGRGTVTLVDADPAAGVMLLERLGGSLRSVPVREAVILLSETMRRLAVEAPASAPSTADRARRRALRLEQEWHDLRWPFDSAFLEEALAVSDRLSRTDSTLAVDADLHSAQVLQGAREPWLVVDPVLLRGDIEFDLGRVLWTRVDEMPDPAAITSHFDEAVASARLDRSRARDWVVFRTVDYWLWGLGKGLTEDPVRCHRIASALT